MHLLAVNGVHLVIAVLGFSSIWFLARSARWRALMWPAALGLGALGAAYLFYWTEPSAMFNDFRRCYWKAGAALWSGPQALWPLYDPSGLVFVNLPIVAYAFAPFGLMSPWAAAIAHLIVGVGVVVLIWRMLVRLASLDARASALVAFALAVFGPLLYSFREGNTSHHVLALLLGGVLSFRAGKDWRAGALFGLAALIKPALILVGGVYLLRGRWRVVGGGAAVIAGAVALSLLVFGWPMHQHWIETSIAPYARGVSPAYAVQTIQSFVLRFEIGGPAGHDWSPHALSGAGKIIAYVIAAAIVAAAGAAIVKSGRVLNAAKSDIEIETWMVVILAAVASTVSWAHYYTWLMAPIVLCFAAASRTARILGVAAFALAAPVAFVSEQMSAGRFGPLSNLVASHWLFAGITALAALAVLRAARVSVAAEPARV